MKASIFAGYPPVSAGLNSRFNDASLNDIVSWSTPKFFRSGFCSAPVTVAAGFRCGYPLVNIQKAMENGHRNSGFSH